MRSFPATLILLLLSVTPTRPQSAGATVDLLGGVDKERKAAFDEWQQNLVMFNSTFFPVQAGSGSRQPVYCAAISRFNESLRQLRASYQKAYDKQNEYYKRWLSEINDDIRTRQSSVARIEQQNARIQNTLKIKEQEVIAMTAPDAEMEQLIKDDPERGKAVREARQRAGAISQASYQSLKNSTFNRTAAIGNIDQRLAALSALKNEIDLSLQAINADLEYQSSYYDLRESEADLRCNSNVRPGPPLLGGSQR